MPFGRRRGGGAVLERGRYAAGGFCARSRKIPAAVANAGGGFGRQGGFGSADARRFTRAAVLRRCVCDFFRGALSGGIFRRLPFGGQGAGGGGLFCAAVFGLRALALGACRFLLSGHVSENPAARRACRPCATAGAVCRVL